ncbi:PLDc N-terminal domain-containing protein, partial [Streptomyces sp. NPDC003327]
MLAELFIIFGLFLYLGRMAPILWIILVILMSMATIVSIVNRSMNPESKVTWLLVAFVPVFGPLLYIMFGERRLSKKEMKQLKQLQSMVDREDNSRALRLELKEQGRRSSTFSRLLRHGFTHPSDAERLLDLPEL